MKRFDVGIDVRLSDDDDATEPESDEWTDRDELGIMTSCLRGKPHASLI